MLFNSLLSRLKNTLTMTAAAGLCLSQARAEYTANLADCTVSVPQEARFIVGNMAGGPQAWCVIENKTKASRSIRLDLVVNRPGLAPEFLSEELHLSANETLRLDLPVSWFSQYGLYHLDFRLSNERENSPWGTDIIAVYPENRQPEPGESVMPIGFATGAPRCTPRLLELAASLGFEYYRYNAVWENVQPTEDTWNWESIDDYLTLVEDYGFRWHVKTTGSPAWAADERFAPPPLDAWRTWITALASRHAESIEFWEVWNEPNIGFFKGSVDEYTQVQRVAHDAIKEVAPGITVTSGGYAGMNHHKSKRGAFEAAFLEYPRGYDWFAYHMHDAFPQFYSDVHYQLAAIQQRTGKTDVPIVFTETGYDTRYGQRFQAETLVKKITYAAAIGAKSYTWYNLMDRSGSDEPNRAGKSFGLITNPTGTGDFASIEDDFRPKESFVAAATAIDLLRRLAPLAIWSENDGVYAFLFGQHDEQLLVGWREDPRIASPIWMVQSNAEKLTRLDLFGNASELELIDGLALIPLSTPEYFLFAGSEQPPRLLGPLVDSPGIVSVDAQGVASIELAVRNPLQREVKVSANALANGVNVQSEAEALTIAAGASGTFPLRLEIGQGRLGEIIPVQVQFTFEGTPWSPTMELPVVFNAIHANEATSITLKELHQVTNKQDYDPYTLHLLWGSPNDLSVEATVQSLPAQHRIDLTCIVTDNQHFAAPGGTPLLEGDALEIAWEGAEGTQGHLAIAGDLDTKPRQQYLVNGKPSKDAVVRKLNITRTDNTTRWELSLDTQKMGLDDNEAAADIRFNFAVHDNDGEGPKSWIAPTPGLGGEAHLAPEGFYLLQLTAD